MSTITAATARQAATRPAVAARLDELLERSATADTAAFVALYDETASQAFRLSVRLLRDHALAQDAVQEAYLTVWRKAASFDPRKGSGRHWILMIVHHTAVSHIRSAEARSAREARHAREAFALHGFGRGPGPDVTHAADEARVVRAALACLPASQREALELAYFGGYTYVEVAELIGRPLGTIKTRIRAGLRGLQESVTIQALWAARNAHQDAEPSPSAAGNLGPDRRRSPRGLQA